MIIIIFLLDRLHPILKDYYYHHQTIFL